MIYVDYTECIPKKSMKFHGGGNYGKRMVKILISYGIVPTLLVPNEFEPTTSMDKQIFEGTNIIRIDDIKKFNSYNPGDTLYIPMIQTRRLTVIKEIKKQNPDIKVIATIHGIRRLDLKPDYYDSYYIDHFSRIGYTIKSYLKYYAYKIAYLYVFRKYIPHYDLIITVSNDSMQKIQNISKPQNIKLYFEGSINADEMMNKEINYTRDNFALFVSGGREEKNLLRTLIGFQRFKLEQPENDLKLAVTGIEESTVNNLKKCKEIDTRIIDKFVDFYGYVDDQALQDLYNNCKYVIYLSKSEGFGLPLLEACMYGTPCLAGTITAMPEVLGSSIEYADPYDLDSIKNGFSRLEAFDYRILQDKIRRKRDIIIQLIKNADHDFIIDIGAEEHGNN